jgi:hypothetical protein
MEYIKRKIITKKIVYQPIIYVELYLLGIIVLYLFGPLEWKTQNPRLFYGFIILAQVLLFLGYCTMMAKIHQRELNISYKDNILISHLTIQKYLNIFITINLIITIMYLMRNTGLAEFSMKLIVENLKKGLTDSASQYLDKFEAQILFGGRWLAPLITLSSPLLWPVLPLSFIYFNKLGLYNKIITLITIFFESARWISTGTNKGVIDLILIIVFIFFLKTWQKKIVEDKKTIGKNVSIIVAIVLLIIGMAFFSNNIGSRLNKNYDTVTLITGNTEVNLDAPLMKVIPANLRPLMVYATQYLTQGYYGLSLALDEPFVPMYGIGNSVFLIENFQEMLGVDLYQYTYAVRISDEGWAPFMNWHSAYTWLANDLSFFGVIVLMYFFGKYFALVSYKSIVYKDPIASVLLCLILLMFFYLPCNNQILSSPLTFMSFWTLNATWLFISCTRNRSINYKIWIKQ